MDVVDGFTGLARLAAELDRSVRYDRAVTVVLVRVRKAGAIDAAVPLLRGMDLIVEVGSDEYLVILPELGRDEGAAVARRLVANIRRFDVRATSARAVAPTDASSAATLLAMLRDGLEHGHRRRHPPVARPIICDPTMERLYAVVGQVADAVTPILIVGESGVGKTLMASMLHARSRRREQALVTVSCAAHSRETLDRILFGAEPAPFVDRAAGALRASAGGTVVLEDIDDLPLALQGKLLRLLEHGALVRSGGVRLIATSSNCVETAIRSGRLRRDLLFRIGGCPLRIPPLRERPSDILPLARHFATVASRDRPAPELSEDAARALTGHTWAGNLHELRSAIELACLVASNEITRAQLPKFPDAPPAPAPVMMAVRDQLAVVEREALRAALTAYRGNQTRAAQCLGISRRALIYKLEKHGLRSRAAR